MDAAVTFVSLFAGIGGKGNAVHDAESMYNERVQAVLVTPLDVATNLSGGDCGMKSSNFKSRKIRDCVVCGTRFKSYNPNPRFCSRSCKDEAQRADINVDEAIRLYETGMTQDEVADALGTTQKAVWSAFRYHGYECRSPAKRDQHGEKNSSWKGGRHVNANGYVLLQRPDHPRAHANGYVFEHILVVEEKIGRPLAWLGIGHPGSEIVHHINGDKQDNRPENLAITTFQGHLELHRDSVKGQNGGGGAECR